MTQNRFNTFIYLVFASILLLLLNLISFNDKFYDWLGYINDPIRYASDSQAKKVLSFSTVMQDLINNRNEINRLKVKNAELEADSALLSETLKKNVELRQQLDLGSNDNIVEAEVLRSVSGGNLDNFIINKGLDDKVRVDDTVVIGNIYIGRVVECGRTSCKVRLPNSRASHYEVVITNFDPAKTNLKMLESHYGSLASTDIINGVAVGTLDNIKVENIVSNATIEKGNKVIVKDEKVSGVYYLGEVTDVIVDPAATSKEVLVKQPVKYEDISTVFIIIN